MHIVIASKKKVITTIYVDLLKIKLCPKTYPTHIDIYLVPEPGKDNSLWMYIYEARLYEFSYGTEQNISKRFIQTKNKVHNIFTFIATIRHPRGNHRTGDVKQWVRVEMSTENNGTEFVSFIINFVLKSKDIFILYFSIEIIIQNK